MNEQNKIQEKDHFVLYVTLVTVAIVGALLMVKLNENEKFAPIKEQINEENRLMNIRVLSQRGE
jgi:cytochrome b561